MFRIKASCLTLALLLMACHTEGLTTATRSRHSLASSSRTLLSQQATQQQQQPLSSVLSRKRQLPSSSSTAGGACRPFASLFISLSSCPPAGTHKKRSFSGSKLSMSVKSGGRGGGIVLPCLAFKTPYMMLGRNLPLRPTTIMATPRKTPALAARARIRRRFIRKDKEEE